MNSSPSFGLMHLSPSQHRAGSVPAWILFVAVFAIGSSLIGCAAGSAALPSNLPPAGSTGFVVVANQPVDAIAGRPYNDFPISITGGGASISRCTLSGDVPQGLQANPSLDGKSCLLSMASASAADVGQTKTFTLQLTSGGTTVSQELDITIRGEFSITEPSLADGVLGRPYTKVINTDIAATDPNSDIGRASELGNGPLSACNITGLPAGTGLNISASGADCTLSGTPTAADLAASPIAVTVEATDQDIIEPDSGAVIVAAKTITKAFTLTIQDLSVVPFTVVDGIRTRTYSNTLTVDTALLAGAPNALTSCSLSGLPAGITATCTIDPGGISATLVLSGPPTAVGTSTVTISLTDSDITQDGAVVTAAGTANFVFDFTIREEFTVTEPALVDGIAGRSYTKHIDTDLLTAAGPDDLNEGAEIGNGAVAACSATLDGTALPTAGFTIAAETNGCRLDAPSTHTLPAGDHTLVLDVTDNNILQNAVQVVPARTASQTYTFTIRNDFAVTEPFVVDGIVGRAYSKHIDTDLLATAGGDDINETGETGNGPGVCSATIDGNTLPFAGFTIANETNGCRLDAPSTHTLAAGDHTLVISVIDNNILQDGVEVVPAQTAGQTYTFTIRNEFAVTEPFLVDGIVGRTYSKHIDTDLLAVAGPDDLNETAEIGNGAPAACSATLDGTALPTAGFSIATETNGCHLTAPATHTLGAGDHTLVVSVTDNNIVQDTVEVVAAQTVSQTYTFTIRSEFSVTEPALVDGVEGRAYSMLIGTDLLTVAGADDVNETAEIGNGPVAGCTATLDGNPLPFAGFSVTPDTNGCRLDALSTHTLAVGAHTLAINATDNNILQDTVEIVPFHTANRSYSFTIRQEMQIVNQSLPGALENATYTATLTAQLGLLDPGLLNLPAALTWTEPAGVLGTGACAGLQLIDADPTNADNTAVITGTPTTPGACTITVRATDDGNEPGVGNFVPSNFVEATFTIVVNEMLAYVTNNIGGDVRVVDTDTNAATANTVALTGGATPQGIAINPADPLFGYVANGATGDVQVFCTRVEEPVCPAATFPVPAGPSAIVFPTNSVNPTDVAIADVGTFGLVADPNFVGCPAIFVIDTDRTSPTFNQITGGGQCIATARNVAIRPQSDFAYVTTQAGNVVRADLRGNLSSGLPVLTITIPVAGTTTFDVAVSPDGRFAYVTDDFNDRVHVIDTDPSSGTFAQYIASTPAAGAAGGLATGADANHIAFSPDGRFVYVTDSANNVVAAIDPTTLNLGAQTVSVTNNNISLTGSAPAGIALTDDSLKAFVANNASNNVSVIDTDATPSANFQTEITDFDGAANFSGPFGVAMMPNPSLHILNPLPDGIVGQTYDFSVVAAGGMRPYTFSISSGSVPTGLSMDVNGLITGTPTVAGTFNFDVTVVDSSVPQQSDTRSLEITIFDASTITAASPLTDAIVNRTYSNNLDVSGQTLGIFWTDSGLGAGACSGLSLSANGILSGTPTTSGLCQFDAIINDASGEVTRTTLDLNVRAEFSVTAFSVVDAIAGRAYSNSLVVTTNLFDSPTEAGQGGEFGNGPIQACSVLDLLAVGVTATCTPAGTSMTLTLSAPTATLVAPGTTFRIQVTDSPILQGADTVVPFNTLTNQTQPSPFVVSLTIRDEFTVGPITNPVDAVVGRTYTNSVTVPTTLQNNPVPTEVGSAEAGNGPVSLCVVLDGGTTLFDGTTSVNTLNGLTVTCDTTTDRTNPRVDFTTATAVTGGGGTQSTLTVQVFDSPIIQIPAIVVDVPGSAGNAIISSTFTISFRNEFTITSTAPTPTDAVETASYSFTFSVTTDLLNSVTEVGQTAEPGNGPILPTPGSPIGCEITQADDSPLPADFSSSYVLTNPGSITGAGCDVTISSAGVADRATNPFTLSLKLTVRDTPIGSATPSGALTQTFNLIIQSATLSFAVRTVDPGSTTNCTGGSYVDTGPGGDAPDAITGSTYGDPGGGAANGPPNCDLLFEVSGGKTSFTWDTSLGAPPTGISCTQDAGSGAGSRRFRCNSGGAAVTGSTSTLTVRATDGTGAAQGGPFVGSASRIINVRSALALSVSPDPGTNDPVNGRHYGDTNDTCAGAVACAPVVYSAGGGLVPRTFTLNGSPTFPSTPATTPGNGFPDPMTCDITAAGDLATPTTLQCDSGGANVSAGAGSYTANVSVDCANDTAPCATQSANRSVELRDALSVASDEGDPLPPAVQGEPYGDPPSAPVTFTASGGLTPRTFNDPTGGTTGGDSALPQQIACSETSDTATDAVLSCATGGGTITAGLGTYTPTVQVDDSANATTPAGATESVAVSVDVVAPMSFSLITADAGTTTACTGGTFNDATSGGDAPSAVADRTYGDPGAAPAGPPNCDLLFQVAGGRPPYVWSGLGGAAPTPISCTQEGTNNEFFRCNSSGSVVTGSTSTLGVDVTDTGSSALAALTEGNDDQGHSGHTIAVEDALAITSISPLNSAIDGSAYNNVLAGTGGLSPQSWSAPQGDVTPTLNTGDTDCTNLDLASDGTLSGTASINDDAVCTFNTNLDDSRDDTTPSGSDSTTDVTQPFDIPISPTGSPIISNDTLVNGLEGSFYSQSFTASGGAGGNTWVEAGASGTACPTPGGSVPGGTTLGALTGVVDGTATSAGVFSFGVCVEDTSGGFDLRNFTMVVNDALAYTANPNTSDISPIDTTNNTPGTSIAVGSAPRQIALLPDGTRAYVTNQGSGSVSVIDTTSNTVVTTIGTGGSPMGITASPDGTRVYFADNSGDQVGVIDTSTNTVNDFVDTADGFTGTGPFGIDITPNGAEVYVSNNASDNVHVIDTATNTVTATITVGTQPRGVVASPDGRFVFVANSLSDDVAVIDTVAKTSPASSIPLGVVGTYPVGVDVTPDGRKLYVACPGTGKVNVIDTATSSVTASVSLSAASPVYVAVTPDAAFAYVTNSNTNEFSVIDTATDTEIGSSPFTVPSAINLDGISMIPYPVLHITTNTLPDATLGSAYSEAIIASGGVPDFVGASLYSFTTDGTGTTALGNCSLALGSDGVVSGTPANGGSCPSGTTVNFDVTATDSATPSQSVTRTITLTVN